jgi:DNA-binding response OmpR family regulator
MTPCPTCGHYSQKDVVRRHLRVQENPLAVFWHGKLLTNMQPAEIKVIKELAKHGSSIVVPHFLLSMAANRPHSSAGAIKVTICNLRKKLPAGIAIKNHHGEGYELELEDDQ